MDSQSFQLPEGHAWSARPGYNCLVLDRGAARFEIPMDWHIELTPTSLKVTDAPPPDDECCLEVSLQRIPVEPERVPIRKLLLAALEKPDCDPPVEIRRHNLRLAWTERRFLDPGQNQPARARTALALARGLQLLITFAFWEHDHERVAEPWQVVLETLRMGVHIPDPLTGREIDPTLQ